MNRATVFQSAVAVIMIGLFLILAGVQPAPSPPAPAKSWRPATELEEREHERKQLHEEMDRLWEQRQR